MPMPVSATVIAIAAVRHPMPGQLHPAAGMGELDGVGQQVDDHLLGAAAVGGERQAGGIAGHAQGIGRGHRPSAASCARIRPAARRDRSCSAAGPACPLPPSRYRGCRRSRPAGACRPGGCSRHIRRICSILLLPEMQAADHFGESEDRVERRAQLVAHVGEERALGAAGGLGGLPLVEVEVAGLPAQLLQRLGQRAGLLLLLGDVLADRRARRARRRRSCGAPPTLTQICRPSARRSWISANASPAPASSARSKARRCSAST